MCWDLWIRRIECSSVLYCTPRERRQSSQRCSCPGVIYPFLSLFMLLFIYKISSGGHSAVVIHRDSNPPSNDG